MVMKSVLKDAGAFVGVVAAFFLFVAALITAEPIVKVLEPFLLIALGIGLGVGGYALYKRQP